MSDQPDAVTSTWQHTTLIRDKHPCTQRNSKPQSQQASRHAPTPYTAHHCFCMYSSTPLSKFIEACDYLILQSHKIVDKCILHIALAR